MMVYDLTNTRLAQGDEPAHVPNQGELLAIVVGLLIVRQKTLSELAGTGEQLVLDAAASDQLAGILSRALKPLNRELAVHGSVRERLDELVGMRVEVAC
jgi:hypothetical protein